MIPAPVDGRPIQVRLFNIRSPAGESGISLV